MVLVDIAEKMEKEREQLALQKDKQLEELKLNSKHVIGIHLFNFVSGYYDQFKDGMIKYIDHESWKVKYKENVKDARIILCLIDELSIKYSDCITELNNFVENNQVVVFVNIHRYSDRRVKDADKQTDLSKYLTEAKLRFNYRLINSYIPDECIQILSSYLERKEPIQHTCMRVTKYDHVLCLLKDWLIIITETNKEFLDMPRMISTNELEDHIHISLGHINDKISTVVEKMFQTHRQNTEELIESVISRILKDKFESISEKLQKKYEVETNSNKSHHDKLQYVLQTISDNELTMYPIFSVPGLGLDEVKLKDIIEKDNILHVKTTVLESVDQYFGVDYSEEDIVYIERMYTFINFLKNNLTKPAELFFDKNDPYIKSLWNDLDYPYTIFLSRIKTSLDRFDIVTIQDLFQRYTYLDVYEFTPNLKWFGCVRDILLSLGLMFHYKKITFL